MEERLAIPVGGTTLVAYFARAGQAPSRPGVLVIHEAFGLNDNIRDIARRFAREGYHALAVELFSTGNHAVCLARLFAGILARPLRNGTVATLRAAIDHLQRIEGVDPRRVGVIGFCLGGSYALQLACVDDELRVASVFYGQNPRPLAAFGRACPIVGSYPEGDFTAPGARTLDRVLDEYRVPHDIKLYPNTKHSFFNDTSGAHDPAASTDAWQRTLAFFAEHLG